MPQTSWRIAAGALALAIGGFVVYAQDHRLQLASDDRTVAACDPIPGEHCPYAYPVEIPPIVETVPTPVVMFEAVPMVNDYPTPILTDAPSPIAPTCPLMPAVPEFCEAPPAPKVMTPPASIRTAVALSQTVPASTIGVTIPYKVRMENSGGVTRLELVRGEGVALTLNCDRIDVSMPGNGLCAVGRVTLAAPGIEVRCNRVTIAWQSGDMTMEGQVRVQCQSGDRTTEMAAELINCRLSTLGTGIEFVGGAKASQ